MSRSPLILSFLLSFLFTEAQVGIIKVRKPKLEMQTDTVLTAEQSAKLCLLTVSGVSSGGEIALKDFLSATGPEFWDTTLCTARIERYLVVIIHGSSEKRMLNDGKDFSGETKTFLQTLQPGDVVYFDKLFLSNVFGSWRYLYYAKFIIK